MIDGQKIAFLGDSITQAGAAPKGYVRLVIRGFFAELLRNIKNEVIETRLIDHIDRELGKVSS